jgi:hypothetical protein
MAKFQGRGKVYLYDVDDAGIPGAGFFVGCADELPLNLAVDTFEHIERCTGNDSPDFTGTKKKTAKGSIKLSEINAQNLALGLNGTIVPADVSAGTVTAEALPTGLDVGSSVMLGGVTPHANITTLVLTPTPSGTLVADTDYTLNAITGTVTFLKKPTATSIHAAYGYTDGEQVSIFTSPQAIKWLRFDYLNKADNNKKGVVDLYKCRFAPTSTLPLITDELLIMDLAYDALIDTTKPETGELGQFGRITTPA